jgi:hypothetical protein
MIYLHKRLWVEEKSDSVSLDIWCHFVWQDPDSFLLHCTFLLWKIFQRRNYFRGENISLSYCVLHLLASLPVVCTQPSGFFSNLNTLKSTFSTARDFTAMLAFSDLPLISSAQFFLGCRFSTGRLVGAMLQTSLLL